MFARQSFRIVSALFLLSFSLTALASSEWKEKVLYSFQGVPDGWMPAGGVVFDKAGNLYGATTDGGAKDCISITQCGTVYQLTPPAKKGDPWKEKVLHIFRFTGNQNDGDGPVGGVTLDDVGNLYGTTAYGGTGNCMLFGDRVGCGTVYELMPPKAKGGKWTEKVLYSFQSGTDGYFPWGDLTWDKQGNLYGATQFGGGYGKDCDAPFYQYCGTVFKLSPPKSKDGKWTEQVLYSFKSGMDGANPNGGLVFDSKGSLYGTTVYGGNQSCGSSSGTGCGTVFELQPPSQKNGKWAEKILLVFKPDGSMGEGPAAGVIFGKDGNLYGTTLRGGHDPDYDVGTAFRLSRLKDGTWVESLLHSFLFAGSDGFGPLAKPVFDDNGNLYGTASSSGGPNFAGTVYRMEPPAGRRKTWAYAVLYPFGMLPDAEGPQANLIFDQQGNLYSTTAGGGSGTGCRGGCGAVFELQP
jgi:hypothetical protein